MEENKLYPSERITYLIDRADAVSTDLTLAHKAMEDLKKSMSCVISVLKQYENILNKHNIKSYQELDKRLI